MKKLFLTALLAALGTAITARAQVSANMSDLVLGFRATGGQGQNVNLEVNLGSAGQFIGQSSGTTLLLSRLSAVDLSATYGANWATRTDLVWGIVGTAGRISGGPNGAPVATVWATRAEDTVGTQSAPWTPGSIGAQFNASSQIEALLAGAPGSLNGASATANSTSSATINATLAGSYTYQDSFQVGTSFSFFNPTINNAAKPASGTYTVSDLYELRPGASAASYVGSFGLSTSGTLTFSTTPATFTGASGAPTITTQPVAQAVSVGANVTFTVAATGSGTLSYQWLKNGVAISGATSSTYTIGAAAAGDAADYSVRVSNASGSITSTGFGLVVGTLPNPGRLTNLSVLTSIGNPPDNFTFGFVVGGAGTSGNKPMLMRAAGPSLTQLGVTGVLVDPLMEFYNGTTKLSQNDDWSGDASILTTAAAVGAFPYTGATSKDSAIYVSAIPLGNDSVKISGVGATSSGAVIAELYDATPNSQFTATTPRLVNVSVLKNIGSSITVGFYVSGSTNVKVMVRAVGPGLIPAPFNVPNTVADPKLSVFNAAGASVASNDDWGTPVGTGAASAAQLSAAFTQVSAFALAPGSKDAAVLVSLAPGSIYTVQVTPTGATGTAIVEVYEVP